MRCGNTTLSYRNTTLCGNSTLSHRSTTLHSIHASPSYLSHRLFAMLPHQHRHVLTFRQHCPYEQLRIGILEGKVQRIVLHVREFIWNKETSRFNRIIVKITRIVPSSFSSWCLPPKMEMIELRAVWSRSIRTECSVSLSSFRFSERIRSALGPAFW